MVLLGDSPRGAALGSVGAPFATAWSFAMSAPGEADSQMLALVRCNLFAGSLSDMQLTGISDDGNNDEDGDNSNDCDVDLYYFVDI